MGHGVGARDGGLPAIQALRAIAALAVAVCHLDVPTIGPLWSRPYWAIGPAGVDLFFVLSGFIIVYSSEPLFGRHGAPLKFILRRLARIVPLYWVLTGVTLWLIATYAGSLTAGGISANTMLASFLFVPFARPDGTIQPILAIGWTLNYEMFFYTLFALALFGGRRAAVIWMSVTLIVLVLIGLTFPLPQPYAFWCAPIVLEFMFGMWIAFAYRQGVRIRRRTATLVMWAGIAGYLASIYAVFGDVPRVLGWGLPAACVVAGVALRRSRHRADLPTRAFGVLGDASYALYLLHPLVYFVMPPLLSSWIMPALHPVAYALIMLGIAIGAAILTHRLFERPVLYMLNGGIILLTAGPSPQLRRLMYQQAMEAREAVGRSARPGDGPRRVP